MLWFQRHVMRRRLSADGRSERGATAVEYGVILTLFVAGMFGAITLLRTSLNNSYAASETRIGSPQSQLAAPSLPSYDPGACGTGFWQDPLSGQCVTSQQSACATAGQAYVTATNSCLPCTASEWFNATTVACDVSTRTSCNASSQGWNSSTNTCIACTASQPYDGGTGTCTATVANCPITMPFDSTTSSCKATAANCSASTPFDSTTQTCNATAANCSTLSPARYYNASGGTCDVIPTCTNASLPYDSTTNTCKATSANCASAGRWYNSTSQTCDAVPTCSNASYPYDTTNNTCRATASTCAAAGRWLNTANNPDTCDAIPSCTNAASPYDSVTNTCKATAANCATQSPPRYLNGSTCSLITAPGAPTGVSGTRGPGTIAVTWTAPTATNGAAITDYVVQYSTSASGPWTTFADGTSTSTSATITGLTNGTAYYVRVAAVNSAGTGTYSSVAGPYTPKAVYSGATPNNRYPASGYTTRNDNSGNYTMTTIVGSAIPNITYAVTSTLPSGVTFNSASPGTFNFGNWNNNNTAITMSWTIAETATTQGASGTLTFYVT